MDFRSMDRYKTDRPHNLARPTRDRGNRRRAGLLLLAALVALLALTGCIGKSTANPQGGNVQTVTINPTATTSLEFGKTQNFSASARDSAGRTVFTTIHFLSDNNAALTISNNGVACAGVWDSLSNPVRCTPGVEGIAHVTAEAAGVSSTQVTIYVHQHIQSILVTPVGTQQCLKPPCTCFSQGTTANFQATAYGANNFDITSTVGPISWLVTTAGVLTITSDTNLPNNQVEVTAKTPGITQLLASASGTTGVPFGYTTCLVKSIMLQVQGGSGNSTSLNGGGTKTLVATVLDTLDVALTKPPLTWSTSNPEVATVNSSGTVTGRQTAGTADISASCTPPTCNIGVLPGLSLYSTGGTLKNGQSAFGVIVANVTQAKPPTATAWAATTDCKDNFNCTSAMFPVVTGKEPIGTAIGVPYTPNSMRFTPAGGRVYMGSDKGLMFVDVGSQSPAVGTVAQATTPCNVAVCGKVLAISADSNRVVVSDTTTIPNQVYIFDAAHSTTPSVDLLIDGATAASFSPDQMKLFILTNTGRMFVYSTVDALSSVPLSTDATDLAFSADGSFAYVAGVPVNAVSGFATCNLQNIGSSSPALASNPLRVVPLPSVREEHIFFSNKDDGDDDDTDPVEHSVLTQDLIALEPPNLQLLTAQFSRDSIDDNDFNCNAPFFYPDAASGFKSGTTFNLGQGAFTPLLMQVTGDGTQVIIVAEHLPAVLIFDINSGTTSAISLVNNADPLAASATLDGTQVFVGSCDGNPTNPNTCGSVHIVNTQLGGDLQQGVYTNFNTNDSMCNNLPGTPCLPNLIAVKPQ
ncbi:MAG: hypothetical protein HY010_19070 [Acidobacteria bacterium]|nr:hypothetical protein [Acidobacteriota bacterium]